MKHSNLIVILVLLLICVIVWIGGNVYYSLNKSTISDTTNQDLLPINPAFDIKTVDNLKKREKVTPVFELENPPTPAPVSVQTSSPSAKLDLESASEEGTILP